MAVKVLIERWERSGREEIVWQMIRDLRSQAVRSRGYLYGETWRSVETPRMFVVLSVWGSVDYWETWAADRFRQKINEQIEPLLSRPSRTRVFEEVVNVEATRPRRGRGAPDGR